jgi:hypothetical protein
MALVLMSTVAELPQAVEEYGPRQGVSGFPFVQANVDPPPKV